MIVKFYKKLLIIVSIIILIVSVDYKSCKGQEKDVNFETIKQLDIFYSLYKELNLYYVDPINPQTVMKSGIDQMLSKLDPYTEYIPESKIDNIKLMTTGQYGGIGSLVQQQKDKVIIVQPYEESPAEKAGIIPGDIIKSINGKTVDNSKLIDVSELLRGEPKSKIQLKIERPTDGKLYDFTVIREEIKIKSVPYYGMLTDNIGYICLGNFTNTAEKEVKQAFEDLKQKNKSLNSLVIDLRGNPGGLLLEAVKISNLFIEKGAKIVDTKGKVSKWDNTYFTPLEVFDANVKLAVLVNSSSASASEIVAGAIQDYDRGVVIGQRTFGKGLVQTTRELSYNAMLKLTTAKYYIPSGRCIQALDYSHKNPDGSVGQIPDSLISEFKTKNGRKVYDGGGILPDILVKPKSYSNIATNLLLQGFLFDYAVQYRAKHNSIPKADQFIISENEYNDFVNWIEKQDFTYTSASESILEDLISAIKEEKYYNLTSEQLDTLSKLLSHNQGKDLITFKDEIIDLLSQEIILKYYNEKGRILFSIKNDEKINTAIEILNKEEEYARLLQP